MDFIWTGFKNTGIIMTFGGYHLYIMGSAWKHQQEIHRLQKDEMKALLAKMRLNGRWAFFIVIRMTDFWTRSDVATTRVSIRYWKKQILSGRDDEFALDSYARWAYKLYTLHGLYQTSSKASLLKIKSPAQLRADQKLLAKKLLAKKLLAKKLLAKAPKGRPGPKPKTPPPTEFVAWVPPPLNWD